uniref:Uncharacterized protein n=1 Tax=Romanomermis culicivorax TaxID=13658 RepID=A0A915JNB2_ROMCU
MNFTNGSSNQSTGQCFLLVADVWMGLESTILLSIALMSQMSNIICFNILIHTSSGHVPNNVKILLCICNMAYFLRSFCLMIKSLYNFCLIIVGFGYFHISVFQCIVVEYFYLAPVVAVYVSTLAIGLDRFHKTMQKRATDNGKATWIRVACQVIWVLLFSTTVYALFAIISQVTLHSSQTVCYCYSLLVFKKQATYTYTFGSISLNVASCVVYYFVYSENRKILNTFGLTTAEHNLSDRFVKYANIKASRHSPVLINLARSRYPWLFQHPWLSRFLFGKQAKVADSAEKSNEQQPKKDNVQTKKAVVEFRLNPQDNVDILADMWNKSKGELKNVKQNKA